MQNLKPAFSLVDCNNFFVSCERTVNPELNNKAVIVLSGNDGCVVARSNEAKALGIAMGIPFFKIKDFVKKHGVIVCNTNFSLYKTITNKIRLVLFELAPKVMIYSVDEAFLDLTSMQKNYNLEKFNAIVAKEIYKQTQIPVSIGVAQTKTLAKVANHYVKLKQPDPPVFYLKNPTQIDLLLTNMNISQIWGVGSKSCVKLENMGISNALALKNLENTPGRKLFNVSLQHTISELNGDSCIKIKDYYSKNKQIQISRTSSVMTTINELKPVIASYITTAAKKLRDQQSVCGEIVIFIRTSLFSNENLYRASKIIILEQGTDDTVTLIKQAHNALEQIYKPGYNYRKVGVILQDIRDAEFSQLDLFASEQPAKSKKVMRTIDSINAKFGNNCLTFAASNTTENK